MRILIACEFSGIVRDAFAAKGHDAYSCDLLPTERPGNHIQGDVLEILNDGWDLMIAHPPCQYLANSGVRWLYEDFARWSDMAKAAVFFRKLLQAPIHKKAIENPIMHKHAAAIINCKPTQTIQPFQFGHPESKATNLWLENLLPLRITANVEQQMASLPKRESHRVHYASPGPERWKERSRTLQGISTAMADQWGTESTK